MTDTPPPWYRQFWPWFIIALPASVVVAGFVTLYIALQNPDSLVADNYYKEGLAINQELARDRVALELAVAAELELQPEIGQLRLGLSGDAAPRELKLAFIHPTSKAQDFSTVLQAAPTGDYVGDLPRAPAGRWYLELTAEQPRPWRLSGELDAGRTSVTLRPEPLP